MRYIVGLDVDELLRQFVRKTQEVYMRENPGHKVEEVTAYDLAPFFQIGKGIYKFFDVDHAKEIYEEADPFPGASDFTYALNEAGFGVWIITNQRRGNEVYTLNWLEKNHIYYDRVLFVGEKDRVMVDALVDDSVEKLVNSAKNGFTAPIAIDRPWNQAWTGARAFGFADCFGKVINVLASRGGSLE